MPLNMDDPPDGGQAIERRLERRERSAEIFRELRQYGRLARIREALRNDGAARREVAFALQKQLYSQGWEATPEELLRLLRMRAIRKLLLEEEGL